MEQLVNIIHSFFLSNDNLSDLEESLIRPFNNRIDVLPKIIESRYIAYGIFVVTGSIEKLFSIDYANIYLSSIFTPHIAYNLIH